MEGKVIDVLNVFWLSSPTFIFVSKGKFLHLSFAGCKEIEMPCMGMKSCPEYAPLHPACKATFAVRAREREVQLHRASVL